MERLMKSLTDEVLNTEDAVKRALNARSRADVAQCEAEVAIGFARIHGHLVEFRQRLGL